MAKTFKQYLQADLIGRNIDNSKNIYIGTVVDRQTYEREKNVYWGTRILEQKYECVDVKLVNGEILQNVILNNKSGLQTENVKVGDFVIIGYAGVDFEAPYIISTIQARNNTTGVVSSQPSLNMSADPQSGNNANIFMKAQGAAKTGLNLILGPIADIQATIMNHLLGGNNGQ